MALGYRGRVRGVTFLWSCSVRSCIRRLRSIAVLFVILCALRHFHVELVTQVKTCLPKRMGRDRLQADAFWRRSSQDAWGRDSARVSRNPSII